MTDISCFWKMKYPSFYNSSVIPTVPCQDSLFPASFLRRGQDVSCLCHFKYSLMPSLFSGHFMKKISLFFPPVPHCKDYCSASKPPSFCPVSCWLHLYSQIIITSTKVATAALRHKTFQLQTFSLLLWPVLTDLDSFGGMVCSSQRSAGTGAQFFLCVLVRLGPCFKIRYSKTGHKLGL